MTMGRIETENELSDKTFRILSSVTLLASRAWISDGTEGFRRGRGSVVVL